MRCGAAPCASITNIPQPVFLPRQQRAQRTWNRPRSFSTVSYEESTTLGLTLWRRPGGPWNRSYFCAI